MIRIAASQTIARPIEDVFAFVSDATNEPKWHTDVLEVSRTSNGPLGAGSTFRLVVDFMGRKDMHVRVAGFEPNRREIIQATSGPMLPMITYLFEAHDSGTRFTRSVEVQPAGLFRRDDADERHRLGIAEERLAAALLPVELSELPIEALGQRAEVLDHGPIALGGGQDVQRAGWGEGGRTLDTGRCPLR